MKTYEVTWELSCTVHVKAESEEEAYELSEDASFGDCEIHEGRCRELESNEIESSKRHANYVCKEYIF